MSVSCPVCLEPLGKASATLKCGHKFCTECLLNSIAKNTGTIEGDTRNKCPMCRSEMCGTIEPSEKMSCQLSGLIDAVYYYDNEVDNLKYKLQQSKNVINKYRNIVSSSIQGKACIIIQNCFRSFKARKILQHRLKILNILKKEELLLLKVCPSGKHLTEWHNGIAESIEYWGEPKCRPEFLSEWEIERMITGKWGTWIEIILVGESHENLEFLPSLKYLGGKIDRASQATRNDFIDLMQKINKIQSIYRSYKNM